MMGNLFRYLCRSAAMLMAMAFLVTGAVAQGQTVERERLLKQFGDSVQRLMARPHAEVGALEAGSLTIDNWMGLSGTAPVRIKSDPNSDTTLVLANEIDLANRRYSLQKGTAPHNVILMANRLRLSEIAQIDLTPKQGETFEARSGGRLFLFVRELQVERNGFLSFRSWATYYTASGYLFGQSPGKEGQLVVCVEKLTLAPDRERKMLEKMQRGLDDLLPDQTGEPLTREQGERVLGAIRAAYTDPSVVEGLTKIVRSKAVYDEELVSIVVRLRGEGMRQKLYRDLPQTFSSLLAVADIRDPMLEPFSIPKPEAGLFLTRTEVREALAAAPEAQLGFSLWVLRRFEQMQTDLLDAARQKKYVEMIQLFREYALFPKYPVVAEHQAAYQQLVNSLNDMRRTAVLPLRSQYFQVQRESSATPQRVTAYARGDSLDTYLAPTTLLLRDTVIKGRRVLGLVRHDEKRPDEAVFYMHADLAVDPWLAELARRELEKQGERYSGVFTDWDLRARDLLQPGIRPGGNSFAVSGSGVRIALPLERRTGGIALLQFSGRQGLPVDFDWTFPTDRSITGDLLGIPLSRTRRAQPQIQVIQGQVTNSGKTTVHIEYIQIGARQFRALEPALEVPAGQTVALPLPAGVERSQVQIPAEAVVSFGANPMNYLDDFYVMDDSELVDEVTLRNVLPRKDATDSEELLRVELTVRYSVKGSDAYVQTEQIILQPATAPGDQKTLWFLRPEQGDRQVQISGKAIYTNGSLHELTPQTFDVNVITISTNLLRRP